MFPIEFECEPQYQFIGVLLTNTASNKFYQKLIFYRKYKLCGSKRLINELSITENFTFNYEFFPKFFYFVLQKFSRIFSIKKLVLKTAEFIF
jgi:hypothetical protein